MKILPLHSIKSKLTLALILFLCAQAVLLLILSYNAYERYKWLVVHDYRSKFHMEKQKVNAVIVRLQEDVKDLSLVGEVFRRSAAQGTENDSFLRKTLMNFFRVRLVALGGGLWFHPYALYPERRDVCYFLFRDGDKTVFDSSYLEDPHNYRHQEWYLTLLAKLADPAVDTAWTRPYVDEAAKGARMITIGSVVRDDNDAAIGLATIDWDMTKVMRVIEDMRLTGDSFTLLADPAEDTVLVTNDPKTPDLSGVSLDEIPWYRRDHPREGVIDYNGVKYMSFVGRLDNGMELVANVPERDMFRDLWSSLTRIVGAYLFAAGLSTVLVYLLLNRFINRPVRYLSEKAASIGGGNLNTEIRLKADDELGQLAGSLSDMAASLRSHVANLKAITAEQERIGAELNIARDIQVSLLPRKFPAFPDRKEFELYAEMHPAKEVGGDFYDFFMLDENRLAVVVADVSGKGVPAALYMVVAKTLINNHTRTAPGVAEAIEQANAGLCENEEMGMFVTAFLSVLDLRTGVMRYVNAGHNPPVMLRRNGAAVLEEVTVNVVLGVLEDMRYKEGELTLGHGDTIILYTDGVTEAMNPEGGMFETEGLLASVERCRGMALPKLLGRVRLDADAFAGDAPQWDDMTMLALTYN